MANKKQIKEELDSLETLKSSVQAFEELAGIRTKKVKAYVLENRDYYSGLRSIFSQVKRSYKKELEKIEQKKKMKLLKGKVTNSKMLKTTAVLISSNTGLYGGLINSVFKLFEKYISDNKADIVIVGRIGLQLYKEKEIKKPYKYFDLSDSVFEPYQVNSIFEYLKDYKDIIIFHGRFENILRQIALKNKVAEVSIELERSVEEKKYLFEPSLEKVLEFFETVIKASIFDHLLYESNLAKYASRMINLYFAREKIQKRINAVGFDKLRLKHSEENRKQLETLTATII